jgi:alanine racemase
LAKIFRPTFVEISLDVLKSNYDFFANSSLGRVFMCPMVKANAYGHGDLQTVKYLQSFGCSTFGVGLVEEGIRLREQGGFQSQILVFGFNGEEATQELLHHELIPVVSDWQQLEAVQKYADRQTAIHLKFNTGMNRLGFTYDQAPQVFEAVMKSRKIRVLGLCTHLMTSEDLKDPKGESRKQLLHFKTLISQFPNPCVFHAYNTSGALNAISAPEIAREYPYGLRIGLGLYGLAAGEAGIGKDLYPVMSLKSKITSVQKVKKGQSVSYGGTWTATKDSTIAIIPVGYADGIPTQLSNRGHVVIQTKIYPIVGRVCMDYTLVDVSDMANPIGQEVEFFGGRRTVHDVAHEAQTIPYDVLTRISERVPRVFVGRSS